MRIEFTMEVERQGLLFGCYEIAAEYDTYQGPPTAVFIEGTKYIKGAVGKSVHREWVPLLPFGHSYMVGLYHAVLEHLATPAGKKLVDLGWQDDEAERLAERNEYRRAKRLPEVAA